MTNKFIFLDLDDTLLDHKKSQYIACEKFYERHLLVLTEYSFSEFHEKWFNLSEKYFSLFTSGKISFVEQRRERIRNIFNNPKLETEKIDEYFSQFLSDYEASWVLFEDVLPFFEKYSGFKFGIISDGQAEQQLKKLKRLEIHDKFLSILTSDKFTTGKPNPEIFKTACKLNGIDPKDSFYIGDNLEKDAIGAINIGMNGVWLNRNSLINNMKVDLPQIQSLVQFTPTL